jgi:glycosyltransferase involved in cell wall biosynthesis
VEAHGSGLLLPKRVPALSWLVNDVLARRTPLGRLALVQYHVARPAASAPAIPAGLTTSVVVPCRNEVGNVAGCVERMPAMGAHTEIIFVDGASTDGTPETIAELIEAWKGRKDIKLVPQVPEAARAAASPDGGGRVAMLPLGKGDAVRKGFAAASGDLLMILDADLTVPPEDLPKFYDALASGRAGLANGSRLVYPLEGESMPAVNLLGNKFFSLVLSWLLEQRVKDTLCGTKALRRSDYVRLEAGRSHFGAFDPFGDFDLLFGAARLGLPIVEVPIRYRQRQSGYSKVRVAKHGWLLLRMCWVALRKLKVPRWRERLGGGGSRPAGAR